MVATNLALLEVPQTGHEKYGHVTKGTETSMKKLLAIMFVTTLGFSAVAISPTTTQAGGPVQITQYSGKNSCC